MFEELTDIPSSDYGYWVSPDGELIPVEASRKHVGFAADILGRSPGGEGPLNDDHRVDLLERGWTRVAMHSGRFVIQLPPVTVADVVIEQLDRIIKCVHREAMLPIHVDDPLTGLAAGGRTVRPGDAHVLQSWRRLVRARSGNGRRRGG